MSRTLTIGIVGIGYWGKNLVRVFDSVANVRKCCHKGARENRAWLESNYTNIDSTTDYEDILVDDKIDAVVIATPIETHFRLVRAALEAGKDVFVEKPMTAISDDSAELVRVAERSNCLLFVGFVFLYDPALNRLVEWDTEIEYLIQNWQKLGSFGVPITENLVCHDVAIAQRVLGEPTDISVSSSIGRPDTVDYFQTRLRFEGNSEAAISVDRLSPTNQKSVTAVTATGEVLLWTPGQLCRFNPTVESFELVCHSSAEPLQVEASAFCRCVVENRCPPTNGEFGLAVNRVLGVLDSKMANS